MFRVSSFAFLFLLLSTTSFEKAQGSEIESISHAITEENFEDVLKQSHKTDVMVYIYHPN